MGRWYDTVISDGATGVWPMQDRAGTSAVAQLGSAGTYNTSGVTLGVRGPSPELPLAARFNGVAGYASLPVAINGVNTISFEWWMLSPIDWASQTSGCSAVSQSEDSGGFAVNPFRGAGNAQAYYDTTGVNYRGIVYARPSAVTWHHYVLTIARLTQSVNIYVDGSLSPDLGGGSAAFPVGNFNAAVLYLASKGGASKFTQIDVAGCAMHPSVLTAQRIAAHYQAALGRRPGPPAPRRRGRR